jgi:hypothetical protein
MQDSTGTDRNKDQDLTMDPADAAAIMAEASDRAKRRFDPDHRVVYAVWGPLWILGYGGTWLAVRGQHPFHGPNPGAFAVTVLIASAAAMITVGQARAEPGPRGRSVLSLETFFLSALAGFGAMFTLEGALLRAGASRPVVGIFEASAPILVLGLIYFVRFSADRNWIGAGLGVWLVVVAAVGGYAGPVAVWAVGALAVGLAYLLVAAVKPRARRA